jgi:hypothetical protein
LIERYARKGENYGQIEREGKNMILAKNGDYTLEQLDCTGEYAVFKKVRYPSGEVMFRQQVSKWYRYRGCAAIVYRQCCEGEKK